MKTLRTIHTRHTLATVVSLFILVGLVLFGASQANAGYKAVGAVYAWDYVANKYQNSNIVIYFDGGWVPFFHVMDTFNNDIYPNAYLPLPPGAPAVACPGMSGSTSQYAGIMEFGLYHTDNAPAGAPGFVRSYEWRIVKCDRNGDGTFSNADLDLAPGTANMVQWAGVLFDVFAEDVVKPCSSGNCQDEIVTSMFVNFDTDCNGVLDPQPPGGLCFYALGQTPTTKTWVGPLQGRISAGGGDKTINFNPSEGPLAVRLSSFAGSSSAVRIGAGLAVLGIGALALALVWRARRKG